RVIAHDVRRKRVGAGRGRGRARQVPLLGLSLEAVHLAAVNISAGVYQVVRAALIDIGMVGVGPDTLAGQRIRHARAGLSADRGKAVGTRVGTEVGVERAILLQNYDHVADHVNP